VGKQTQTVKILYTSDVHGNASPISYGTNEPADSGLATYAAVVKQAKKDDEHIIVIDNGDLIQGTPLMTHYVKEHADQINPMIGLMNEIGIDAGVIGNHEFNFGKQILNHAVEQSAFPWLSANSLDAQTMQPYFGQPYIMKELPNGLRVAIVGVTTHYIPNWESPEHIKGIHFADAFLTLKKWVAYIHQQERPDVLIASYHGGFERDLDTGEPTESLTGENQGYKMCKEIEGIDVLLTGHQHRKLTSDINGVLVIQPGNNGEMYGEVVIELQDDKDGWAITDKHASLHSLAEVEADSESLRFLSELERSTQRWLDEPIGHIEGDMTIADHFQARLKKHPFVEFIQKVQMEAGGVDLSITSLFNNVIEGFSSVVTMRDVVGNYMFPNTLTVLELTGNDIIAAMEKSANYFIIDEEGHIAVNPMYIAPKPQHYNYDMWEGINYTINVAKPVGERIEQIMYHGKPLDTNGRYHVAMNNYRANGGGDFSMFKDKPIIKDLQIDMVELIRAYFEKHKTVQATITDNFTVTRS